MDYCYITSSNTPVLCMKCSRTRVLGANAVRSKEVTPELVRLVAKDIDNMGHARVVIKSDNEPAIRALASRSNHRHGGMTRIRAPGQRSGRDVGPDSEGDVQDIPECAGEPDWKASSG